MRSFCTKFFVALILQPKVNRDRHAARWIRDAYPAEQLAFGVDLPAQWVQFDETGETGNEFIPGLRS